MKINAIVFLSFILLLPGCSPSPVKTTSYMRSVTDTLRIDKTKNLIIYTINPNDCVNCLIGFKSINKTLSKMQNAQVYVVAVEREIEKNELMKETSFFDFSASPNKAVIWSKDAFNKINNISHFNLSISSLCVYNYTLDSIVYCKPIREINNENEVMSKLK